MRTNFSTAVLATLLSVCCFTAKAQVFSDSTPDVLDHRMDARFIDVTSHGQISDLNFLVDLQKCDGSSTVCSGTGSDFASEIWLTLTGPSGKAVSLTVGNFYSSAPGAGRVQLLFDDEGISSVSSQLKSTSFRPVDKLSAFDGTDMYGRWTLTLLDTTGNDPLLYFGSRLAFNGADAFASSVSAVPEPASTAMLGLGLLGFLAARGRMRGKGAKQL